VFAIVSTIALRRGEKGNEVINKADFTSVSPSVFPSAASSFLVHRCGVAANPAQGIRPIDRDLTRPIQPAENFICMSMTHQSSRMASDDDDPAGRG
jgi:hypothetical protein